MERPEEASRIRDYLARHQWTCDVCGYQLHGLVEARCPECGGEIRIGRRLLGPPMPAPAWCWLLVVIDLLACFVAGLIATRSLEGALTLGGFFGAPTFLWVWLWHATSRDPKDRAVNKLVLPLIAAGTLAVTVLVAMFG